MKSRLAEAARRQLAEDVKRMTAEQRLAAFLAHCELLAQLNSAGAEIPRRTARPAPRNADRIATESPGTQPDRWVRPARWPRTRELP